MSGARGFIATSDDWLASASLHGSIPGRLSIASSRGRFSSRGASSGVRTQAPLATRASPSVEGRHEPVDGLASPAMTKGIRDQPGFSRPSRRAISASSNSRSAKGSSTFGGGLTLELAGPFCGGGRASLTCCAPLDAGAGGCCVLATGCGGALGAGTLAAGGDARGSAFAAATAESTFSERGGAPGDVGGGVDGLLPCADQDGWPGPDEDLGGPFSVIRAMGALIPDPLGGAIGGGIAGRVGAGRGGGELAGAGRVGSAGCAAGGEAGAEEAGRPCSGSVGRGGGVVAFAGPSAGAARRGRGAAAGLRRRRQEPAGQRAPERRRTQPRATKRRARRRPSSEALRLRPAQRRQPPRFAARARPARGEATADYSRAPAPSRG